MRRDKCKVHHQGLRPKGRSSFLPSTSIRWIEKEEGILMVPDSEDPIEAARGMFSGSGILKTYLQEKRREKARENKQDVSS